MGKLQMIKRANGTELYSVNIPLSLIKDIRWEKGEDLELHMQNVNGRDIIIVQRRINENG